MSIITEAQQKAAAAQAAAEAAAADLQAAREAAEAQRLERIRAHWQHVADDFEPDALRQDVRDAHAELAAAAAESGLTRAIVRYIAAMRREVKAHALYGTALANGAQAEPVARGGITEHTDARGARRQMLDELPKELLGQAILEAVDSIIDEEEKALDKARREAAGTLDLTEEQRAQSVIDERNRRRMARREAELQAWGKGSIRPDEMSAEQRAQWERQASPRKR